MPFWMQLSIWWKLEAKPWLKNNWLYVVFFPVGLLMLLSAFSRRRRVKVTSTELSLADETRDEARERKAQLMERAAGRRDEEARAARDAHEQKLRQLDDEQKERVERSPEGNDLTRFLRRVGEDVRK